MSKKNSNNRAPSTSHQDVSDNYGKHHDRIFKKKDYGDCGGCGDPLRTKNGIDGSGLCSQCWHLHKSTTSR